MGLIAVTILPRRGVKRQWQRYTWIIVLLVDIISHGATDGEGPGLVLTDEPVRVPKSDENEGHEAFVPDGYNPLMPPPLADGKPLAIKFSVVIVNIRDVRDQEFNMELNMRIHWVDSRLQNLTGNASYLVLSPSLVEKKIWKPDVFIDHVKQVEHPALLSKPASIRLYENGYIRYSFRITILMSCRMNYKYFPADTQHCNIDVKSYAYPKDILVLEWHAGKQAYLADDLRLVDYDVDLHNRKPFTTNSTSGEYAGIRFTVGFKRRMTYHLLQTYLPSTLFLIVGWMTFLMPQDLGALIICTTTMLTITAMFSAVRLGHYDFLRTTSPNASYPKAIDIWMVSCILSVFFALIAHMVTMKMRHTKIKLVYRERAGQNKNVSSTLFHNGNSGIATGLDEDAPSVLAVAYRKNGCEAVQLQRFDSRVHPNSVSFRSIRKIRKLYKRKRYARAFQKDEEAAAKILNEHYKITGNRLKQILGMLNPLVFLIFNFLYWPWLLRQPNAECHLSE